MHALFVIYDLELFHGLIAVSPVVGTSINI